MKRIVLILVALLWFCVPTLAQKVRVFGVAGQSQNIKSQSTTVPVYRTFPSCTITVYNTGTLTPTTIWTDAGGTILQANPFVANTDASYGFFATAGVVVDIRFSGTGITTPFTVTSVTAPNGGGGGGGGGLGDPGANGIVKRTSFNVTTVASPGVDFLTPAGDGSALIGLTKFQVGLGNVDNTSDATKNSAAAILTNKTISGSNNTLSNLPANGITGVIPMTNLATGTPTGSKFLRDDGTLQTIPGGGDALTANPLSQFASTTSAQLATVISNETGTAGSVVFSVSPALTGIPTAPTAAPGTNTTQIATTAAIVAERTASKTLTNTTLTSPTINSPTITTPSGLVKGDVGLGNVDNTSDATKNSAAVTLTNKTISGASNTLSNIAESSVTNLVSDLSGKQSTLVNSAGLAAALSDETGNGSAVFGTSPNITTPNLTIRTQPNNTTIVANSPYRNTGDNKLYIGAADGLSNHELFEAGVSGPVSNSNGGTGSTLGADTVLSTTSSVDLNTGTATLLYTCPAASTCAIIRVLVTAASTSLTTASYSFGWNSATFNDVIADATHTELTGSTLYTFLNAKVGAKLGAPADTFKIKVNVLQGGAATVTIKVFGYVY